MPPPLRCSPFVALPRITAPPLHLRRPDSLPPAPPRTVAVAPKHNRHCLEAPSTPPPRFAPPRGHPDAATSIFAVPTSSPRFVPPRDRPDVATSIFAVPTSSPRFSLPVVAMPSKKLPKSNTRFFSARAKPSSNFGMEFTDAGRRFWLDTYSTAYKAARANDVAVWRVRRPKTYLNFPKIETRSDAEFLVPEGIQMEEITSKKRPTIVVSHGDSDEATVVRFAREHSEYVQARQEYLRKRVAEQKKKKKVKK